MRIAKIVATTATATAILLSPVLGATAAHADTPWGPTSATTSDTPWGPTSVTGDDTPWGPTGDDTPWGPTMIAA